MAKEGIYKTKSGKNKGQIKFVEKTEKEETVKTTDYIPKNEEHNETIKYEEKRKKGVDYYGLAEKNKRIREFGTMKGAIKSFQEDTYKPFTIQSGLRENANKYKNKPEDRERKYTYGLATFDGKIKAGSEEAAYREFFAIKNSLAEEEIIPKERVKEYQKALARRGYRLVNKLHKDKVYKKENEDILRYCGTHLINKSSKLEKTITFISMLSIILGITIGYPALTGNVIASHTNNSVTYGSILFVIGILGVFLANKR